jgi:hypothetical protein
MTFDREFSAIGKNHPHPKPVWRWVRWFLVYPLLGLSGCHMLLTGSPIPLWYTEHLDRPVLVKEVTEKSLILADGRSVRLPFIKRLPVNDPVFRKALERGVEVGQDGEIVGLLTVYPYCGNDPYKWHTKRVNLSDLAGVMEPGGIDDSIVSPEEIKLFAQDEPTSLDRNGLPFFVLQKANKVRSIYTAAKSRAQDEPNVTRLFSRAAH